MTNKKNCLWISQHRSGLGHERKKENVGGYAATTAVHAANQKSLSGGPVNLKTNPEILVVLREQQIGQLRGICGQRLEMLSITQIK